MLLQARAVKLDELADDAFLAQHLRDGQRQVGRRRAFRQLPGQLEADDFRRDEIKRLAEHAGFRFDAADAPADDAETVDHRRMRVRADERIREHFRFAVHCLASPRRKRGTPG